MGPQHSRPASRGRGNRPLEPPRPLLRSPYLILILPLLLILGGQSCAKLAGAGYAAGNTAALAFAAGTYLFFALRGVVWAVILKRMKLSVAYPVLSLSFPSVLLLSHLLFDEPVSPYNAAGAAVVILGILLIARGEAVIRRAGGRR